MGTITGISDLDSVRWKSSQWRNLQVKIRSLLYIKLCAALVCEFLKLLIITPYLCAGWLG